MKLRGIRSLMFVMAVTLGMPARAAETAPRWRPWSDDVFEQARREQRFVLLDLGAVWCHWCHVMEETTYKDPEVLRLIDERFVAVQVDQDARPDLSNRYEDYGWPATIVFAADGSELVKFQGYIPPRRMAALLQGVIDDPTPGPSVTGAPAPAAPSPAEGGALGQDLRKELHELLRSRYDQAQGGWGFAQKFLDWDAAEYCLELARAGDAQAEHMARETLDRQLGLIDPVWGGVYQYSDSGDWAHPHFEKIMAMQAENLRLYALAYAQWRDPRYLKAAQTIEGYLGRFLSAPNGAFYTSQDADVVQGEHSGEYFALGDAERRAKGLPRVDTHVYTRENAWAGHALLALYAVSEEQRLVERARQVARLLLAERGLPGGGFRHDAQDAAGPYLGDNVAALRLLVALYSSTGEREWLAEARQTAEFIEKTFGGATAGYATAARGSAGLAPVPQRDENIALARSANLLYQYDGRPSQRRLAEQAARFLAIPEVARRPQAGGVLLADTELGQDPLHVTVVGAGDDPASRALLRTALGDARAFKRVELWDKRQGPLPRNDVSYPQLKRPAAFLCTAGRCSPPAYTPEELLARLRASLPGPRSASVTP